MEKELFKKGKRKLESTEETSRKKVCTSNDARKGGEKVQTLTKEILSLAKESQKGSPSSWLSTFEKKLKNHLKPEEASESSLKRKSTQEKSSMGKVSLSPIPEKKTKMSSPWLNNAETSLLSEPDTQDTTFLSKSESRNNSSVSVNDSSKPKKRKLGTKLNNLTSLLKTPDNNPATKGVFAKPAPRARSDRKLRTPSFLTSEQKNETSLDVSDWDSDEEDLTGVAVPGYFYPQWAKREAVNKQLTEQRNLDPNLVFGRLVSQECDLGSIFMDSTPNARSKYEAKRTPSAKWTLNDRLSFEEEKRYRKEMGFQG